MIGRIRLILLLTVAVAGGATVAVAALPSLSFGYENPIAHTAIETTAAVVSVLAAFILYGRFQASGRLSELILFAGLALLALRNLIGALEPVFAEERGGDLAVWPPLLTGLVAGATLAVSAWTPDSEARDPRRARRALPFLLAAVAGALVGVALLSPQLGTGIDPSLSPRASEARIIGSPGLLSCQIVLMSVLVAASVGFARRAERTGDELMAWLSLGTMLGALARVNYFLFPSIYSDFVFTGDFLRLGFYLAILIGALRQISGYQRAVAAAAVREERTRIARDLHDSLAQDLAFISLEGTKLAERDPRAGGLATAAADALAASRGAIIELRGADEPLGGALARLASTLAGRRGIRLRLEFDESADASPQARNDLLRITSEAISNAIRHGRASEVWIRLRAADGGLRLSILDDGTGFDPETAGSVDGVGFGLTGMRERVARLGGTLRLNRRPEGGTEVEVMLP